MKGMDLFKFDEKLSKYFKGKGEKVMKAMQKQYGEKKGKTVFYATANKLNIGPSDKVKKKYNVD